MQVYLDANVIIYAIEGEVRLRQEIIDRLLDVEAVNGTLITSRLSVLECRVKPLRESNTLLLESYGQFFNQEALTLRELSAAVIDRATELRAQSGFKTPDALHLATAIDGNADLFLTGDVALAKCHDIKVELL